MHQSRWNARRKLLVSLTVLAVVLGIAAVAQFTGSWRESPKAAATSANPQPHSRAVFGVESRSEPIRDTRPNPMASTLPTPQPEAPREAEPSTRARADTASIEQFLERWKQTVSKGDVDGQANLYAPKVDRFFRQRNVSQASVRKVKAQMMSLYPTVNHYDISDVKVESNNGTDATISLRKEWDMMGNQRFSGAERQRLKLRRIAGDWKIVSEEETKVYWVKRGG